MNLDNPKLAKVAKLYIKLVRFGLVCWVAVELLKTLQEFIKIFQ